ISVDGIFGSRTKDAVIQFQKTFGLSPDGLVGNLTWDKLYEIYRSII
ncbi:MAG: peptidoglycan-binding domain-containing protein, partial [Clostridium sp.]